MYDVVLLIHILSAMVWVGGGFLVLTTTRHVGKVGGLEGAHRIVRDLEWADTWIFTPAPLMVIATGVTMVIMSDAWSFTQPWGYVPIALILVEFIVGDRDVKRMRAAHARGADDPEFGEALAGYLRIGFVALGLFAVIVFLMVFKPGL
jgi:uncharacterized membrane protein